MWNATNGKSLAGKAFNARGVMPLMLASQLVPMGLEGAAHWAGSHGTQSGRFLHGASNVANKALLLASAGSMLGLPGAIAGGIAGTGWGIYDQMRNGGKATQDYNNLKQNTENNYKSMLQERMAQIAPQRAASDPEAFMSSDFQRAVLGDTIENLVNAELKGQQPKPFNYNPNTARQILQSNYNIY
jgi:hypothetical protein